MHTIRILYINNPASPKQLNTLAMLELSIQSTVYFARFILNFVRWKNRLQNRNKPKHIFKVIIQGSRCDTNHIGLPCVTKYPVLF